jgi:hypothetical protein
VLREVATLVTADSREPMDTDRFADANESVAC